MARTNVTGEKNAIGAASASERLRIRISANLPSATRGEQAIANYFLNEVAKLPFETAASVAAKIGVSEGSIGRFCRSIGFRHFKELKLSLGADLGNKAWLIGDRLTEFAQRSRGDNRDKKIALEREVAAVIANHELAATPTFNIVKQRLAKVRHVFIAGFQTERGHARYLADCLSYLRPGVRLMDTADGHFSDVLIDEPENSCLVLIDGRRYSRLARDLALAAREAGVPVTLITDPYCDWASKSVDEVLVVQTDLNQFWDGTSTMSSLIGLLVNGVFEELGPVVESRMDKFSSLYDKFVGHVPPPNRKK